MNRSRRCLIAISFVVSFTAVTLLMAALYLPQVAADNGEWYFVVCKHEDLDKDGVWESMERDPPLNGWTFDIEGPAGPLGQQTTSGDGCTQFPTFPQPGTYTVCEHLQDGWVKSYPNGAELCIPYAVQPGATPYGPIEKVFGNYRLPVGGETEPASRLALLAPWLGLGAVILFAGAAVVMHRRRARST